MHEQEHDGNDDEGEQMAVEVVLIRGRDPGHLLQPVGAAARRRHGLRVPQRGADVQPADFDMLQHGAAEVHIHDLQYSRSMSEFIHVGYPRSGSIFQRATRIPGRVRATFSKDIKMIGQPGYAQR